VYADATDLAGHTPDAVADLAVIVVRLTGAGGTIQRLVSDVSSMDLPRVRANALFPRRGDMNVYLMQHGEAAAKADDPARPLTVPGRAAVTRVAYHAQAAGVRVDHCLHSGKLRAQQTAQILAAAVGSGPVDPHDGLAPNDSIAPMAEWLHGRSEDESVAVVGHLPFLDRLASKLVAADENAQVISFQMGGLVKLIPKPDRAGFAIAWILVPDIA
jgi:phosphohistidine phosphatase